MLNRLKVLKQFGLFPLSRKYKNLITNLSKDVDTSKFKFFDDGRKKLRFKRVIKKS